LKIAGAGGSAGLRVSPLMAMFAGGAWVAGCANLFMGVVGPESKKKLLFLADSGYHALHKNNTVIIIRKLSGSMPGKMSCRNH
jgi:hypothetical protein